MVQGSRAQAQVQGQVAEDWILSWISEGVRPQSTCSAAALLWQVSRASLLSSVGADPGQWVTLQASEQRLQWGSGLRQQSPT